MNGRDAAVLAVALMTWLATAGVRAGDRAVAYDARLSAYDYPFPVETFAVPSQGQNLEMAYMHLPADGRPTVLLLHGKNFSGAYWADTAHYLQSRGYGVLMPDQVGFGKSSKPPCYQYSFEALASHTRALARFLGVDDLAVMGHSMGGMLAVRYALMYPRSVKWLVLVNPIGLEDYLDYVEYRDPAFFYERELDKTMEDIRAYQRTNYYDGAWSPAYEALIRIHEGWINGPDWPRVAWNNALTTDLIFTGAVVDELPELTMPTHLIIGTRDRTGPGRAWKRPGVDYRLGQYGELGRRAAAAIPRATLHELPGVGHLPQFEAFPAYRQRLALILDELEGTGE